MKQQLTTRILRIVLLLACHALHSLEVDVAKIDNPYVEVRSKKGDSVWISRNDVDHLPSLATYLAQANEQVITSDFSSSAISLIADLVTVSKAFQLQNRKLTFVKLPFFDRDVKPHFFDNPSAFDYNRIYQAVNHYCEQAPNPSALLELLDASARFFPPSVLQVVVWSALQKQKSPDLLTLQLPQSLKSHKLLLSYLHRCAYPPAGSLFKMVLEFHKLPLSADLEENVVTVYLRSKQITSLFGLGALCFSLVFKERLQQRLEPLLAIDLSENQISVIDEIDALECSSSEHKLMLLDLKKNQITSIANQFLSRATSLASLDLSNNRLEQLPPRFLENSRNLYEIHFDFNQLEEFPADVLSQAVQLQEFSASYNYLKRLPEPFVPYAQQLGVLDLSYNLELELSDTFLSGNYPELRDLNIAGLNAQQLPSRMLQNAQYLEYIDLRRNKLTFLPAGIINQKELEALYIEGNPLLYDQAALQTLPQSIQDAIRNAYKVPDEDAYDATLED